MDIVTFVSSSLGNLGLEEQGELLVAACAR